MDTAEKTHSKRRGCAMIGLRLFAVIFGLAMAWLLAEIFVRVAFDALPPDAQGVIQHVRRVPWDDERLIRPLPYIGSREHQAMLAPGHTDYPIRWGDAQFSFDTISLWEMPVGFRTDQPRFPVDVVALGDSFTFCWTEVEDCWVQKLGTQYGWSVMNLGVPGTGSRAHQSLIEPYVRPLEPQVVVWQWYGNDFIDEYDFAGVRGEQPDGLSTPPPAVTPPPDFGTLAEYSAVYRLIRDYLHRQENPAPVTSTVKTINGQDLIFFNNITGYDFQYEAVQWGADQGMAALETSHQTLSTLTSPAGNPVNPAVVFILIPTKEEVYAAYLTDFLSAEAIATLAAGRQRMMAACEANGWRCIDMLDPFRQAVEDGQRVYHGFDFHLDASGNQVIADTLGAYLIEQGLLPAP